MERWMDELLSKATRGVDMSAPDAAWQIFHNLMALVPWWPLFWFTVACVVVGAVLGRWRGRVWFGVATALVLGPVGWLMVLALPRRQRPSEPERGGRGRHGPGHGPVV
jgi:uncharacterized membrane protein YfcA